MDPSTEPENTDVLEDALRKHRRRLWTSRLLLASTFILFFYASYFLLGRVMVLAVVATIIVAALHYRGTSSKGLLESDEENIPLLVRNLVDSLSSDYGIDPPEIVVTNEGSLEEHLYVTRVQDEFYLGISTVYLDLVSEDGLAAGLCHEFEHIVNRDLYGGSLRRFAFEFFVNTAIVVAAILISMMVMELVFGVAPIAVQWSPMFLVLGVTSIGFYLASKWESREAEWIADIGAMKRIGPEKFAKGCVEQQLIYGIPVYERVRDKLLHLLDTHPSTLARVQLAGKASDIPADEFVNSIDFESLGEKAEKYSEFTPDVEESRSNKEFD